MHRRRPLLAAERLHHALRPDRRVAAGPAGALLNLSLCLSVSVCDCVLQAHDFTGAGSVVAPSLIMVALAALAVFLGAN